MADKRTFKPKNTLSMVKADKYRAWKEWKAGDVVIGKLLQKTKDRYGNPSWILEVEELTWQGKPKTSKELIGKKLCLNSAGRLNRALDQVEMGDTVRVEYLGKVPYKNKESGKKGDAFDFDVKEGSLDGDDEDLDLSEDEDFEL